MNKTELIAAIADQAELSKKDYEKDICQYSCGSFTLWM